jgi:hypothetical protein
MAIRSNWQMRFPPLGHEADRSKEVDDDWPVKP